MTIVGEEISPEELFGSDLEIEEIAPERFDLVTTRNGDISIVSGQNYILQRIVHVLYTRARFYPPQIPALIEANITLKENMDESGRHYFPGDLEELGYPEYGSILTHLIGEPNSPQLKVLLMLHMAQSIALEFENGVEEITNIQIDDFSDGYLINLSIRLINNKSIAVSKRIGVS